MTDTQTPMTPEEREIALRGLLRLPTGRTCQECGAGISKAQNLGGGGRCRACNFKERMKKVPL